MDSLATISARATTIDSRPLTRGVDPRKVGYTVEMFDAAFPNVKFETVLESFHNFYIANGAVSKNWFEKFLSYAQGAQDRATVGGVETDSMGLPLDRKMRRLWSGR